MSPDPKPTRFDLFVRGVDSEALQTTVGLLGNLTPTKVEEAEDLILNAAWHCLQATEEENEAPTRPGFADKLHDTRKAARNLFRNLNSIREYVYPIALQYNLLDIEDDDKKREALLLNLMEIESRIPFLINTLNAFEWELRERGLDKGAGGSPSWYESLNELAKKQLVVDCHSLFEGYHPGKATPTKFGPFNNFCEAVYGLALDVDPTADGIGIRRYTEEVCRVSKELARIQTRSNETRRALRAPNLSRENRRA